MGHSRFALWLIAALACTAAGCAAPTVVGGGSGGSGAGSPGTGGVSGGNGTGGSSPGTGGASGGAGTGGASAGTGGVNGTGGAVSGSGTGGARAGTAGASGSGGTSSGAGGSSSGTGGSASSTDGGSATACPGVPIVPDATGLVTAASNAVGIHGSWFEYSDCTDLQNKNCSTVTTPAANSFANVGGKMCTSGVTSTAAGAWGAGIGLELNDGPPQMPYDTTAHGVKGFCFVLSGTTIPSTTIRVAFPTKDNNDNAYFSPVSTPGQHTVLFSDIAQGSWVTTKSAFEPNAVMLVQLQIPSSTTPVPWDFCIEGFTAITQ
jgi:hypothetical protein